MGNIALNKTTAASSFVKPYAPSKAVDGNASPTTPFSRWLCNALPGWLSVDAGSSYLVNRWVVRHMPVAGWASPDYANADFTLQGSNDNTNWVNIDAVTNNSAGITDRTLSSFVAFRFFRIVFTKGLRCNTQLASMVEFEVYQAYSCLLNNLTISAGTLTPAFNPNTLAYTATVDASVASINVTPTAQDPQAVIKVNGAVVVSGQLKAVALAYGSNTVTVNVTDGSGAQKNYVITVTRPGSFLSALTVQSGSTNVALIPSFVKTTLAYTASVASNIPSVTFTPTAEIAGSTIAINNVPVTSGQQSTSFSLVDGINNFNIVVTTKGIPTTYSVAITKVGNLLLTSASVAYTGRNLTGSVNVPVNANDLIYNVPVPSASASVKVTANATSSAATIKVNGVVVASGTQSGSITLVAGTTAISVTVSNSDGSQHRDYTINVTH
jgi:hypothetical protein